MAAPTASDHGGLDSRAATAFACSACAAPVADDAIHCPACGHAVAQRSDLARAATLSDGRYAIVRVIGRGGFGITYEGLDTRLDRPIAIKELLPESAVRTPGGSIVAPDGQSGFLAARGRFLREARILARFAHPGIVRVFEVFEENGTAYLVLELLRGRTLADVARARGGPIPADEVLDLIGRVGSALAEVHRAQLLHRDVSPSNLVLTEDGRVVLIDFGLARTYQHAQTEDMTRIVTPGYAPPEQYKGTARYGPTTDVYGLAATCYRLLTGKVPVPAVEREAGTELPAPHRVVPEVPEVVSHAVLDGMELESHHRPQSVEAFLARIGLDLTTDHGPVRFAVPADTIGLEPQTEVSQGLLPDPDPVAAHVAPGSFVGHSSAPPGRLAGRASVHPHQVPPPVATAPKAGRARITVPLGVTAVSAVAALPVVGFAVVALGALPALATLGDHALRPWEQRRWTARRSPAVGGALSFLRNLWVSLGRCVPGGAIVLVGVALWWLLSDRWLGVAEVLLRSAGLLGGWAMVQPGLTGSSRFRSGVGVEVLRERLAGERRPSVGLVVLWLVCVALTAALWFLHPDPWPVH